MSAFDDYLAAVAGAANPKPAMARFAYLRDGLGETAMFASRIGPTMPDNQVRDVLRVLVHQIRMFVEDMRERGWSDLLDELQVGDQSSGDPDDSPCQDASFPERAGLLNLLSETFDILRVTFARLASPSSVPEFHESSFTQGSESLPPNSNSSVGEPSDSPGAADVPRPGAVTPEATWAWGAPDWGRFDGEGGLTEYRAYTDRARFVIYNHPFIGCRWIVWELRHGQSVSGYAQTVAEAQEQALAASRRASV